MSSRVEVGPRAAVREHAVEPLEEERHPPDLALREGDLEVREPQQRARQQPVGHRHVGVERRERGGRPPPARRRSCAASPIRIRCACRSTVPVSSHAANSGSQWRSASWIDGRPEFAGSSVKVIAFWPARRVAADLRRRQARDPTTARCRAGSGARRCHRTTPRSSSRCTPRRTPARDPCPSLRRTPGPRSGGSWGSTATARSRFVHVGETRGGVVATRAHVGEAHRAHRVLLLRVPGARHHERRAAHEIFEDPPVGDRAVPAAYVAVPPPGAAPRVVGPGSTRGPRARYFAGSHVSHRCGGSTT